MRSSFLHEGEPRGRLRSDIGNRSGSHRGVVKVWSKMEQTRSKQHSHSRMGHTCVPCSKSKHHALLSRSGSIVRQKFDREFTQKHAIKILKEGEDWQLSGNPRTVGAKR